jgi:hypothetical protein
MAYYASGYYHAAKRHRFERVGYSQPALAGAPPGAVARNAADANALQVPPR